jgi:predicted RNA binding protein YcfA (HicA-like mRNA interferase family)
LNTKAKRLAGVLSNPRQVRFEDACRAAREIGFELEGGQGSHVSFGRKDEMTLLNFQNRNGVIPACQAKQLAEMIRRYGDD